MGGDPDPDHQQSPSRGSQMMDTVDSEWTNEKHSSYLSSIEASFVNQLYGSECYTNDMLGRWSKAPKHSNLPGSRTNGMSCGQFKVQRGGCWQKLNFERAKSRADIEYESRLLSANPWIQRFKSPSSCKELVSTPSYQHENRDLPNPSMRLAHGTNRVEATESKPFPVRCSDMHCQDSFGSNREVSDQNFIDDEVEGKQSSGTFRRKKAKTRSVSSEVVPSRNLLPGRKSKGLTGSLRHKHEPYGPSLSNDQEFDSADSNATWKL